MNSEQKTFICEMCHKEKMGEYVERKVDSPFHQSTHYPLIKKSCLICVDCKPHVKEFNEGSLIDYYNRDDNPYTIY